MHCLLPSSCASHSCSHQLAPYCGDMHATRGCTWLRTFHSLARSFPVFTIPLPRSAPAVAADSSGATAGVAFVTPPGNNRPWASYELRVCEQGLFLPQSPIVQAMVASDPSSTPVALYSSCRTIPCSASSDPNAVTACAIPDCTPQMVYVVWATAKQTGYTSPESPPDIFNTDAYP